MGSIPTSTPNRGEAGWRGRERVSCWQCGAEAPGLFCTACNAIQPFPEQADYFEVLGIPRCLVVDAQALLKRYYELHRLMHPDRYQMSPQPARVASLRNTATVNRAYATLRDPIERGVYWLTLQGESLGTNNNRVPPELAELVFDVQEKIAELRAARHGNGATALARELGAVQTQLRERRSALLHQLQENFLRWDAGTSDPATLRSELKQILSALAYMGTLIRDLEKELES